MRGQETSHLGEDGQQGSGRASPGQQRTAKFPEEVAGGDLARLTGQPPVPGACRIGPAEGALHLEAQAQRVELKALRQIGLQRFGDSEDRGRGRGQDSNRNPQNRLCVRNQSMESTKHDGGHVLRQGGGGNAQPTVEA